MKNSTSSFGCNIRLCSLILCGLVIVTTSCQNSEIILVDGRYTGYQIILPEKADKNEQKAASALRKYLWEISGVELVVISEEMAKEGKGIWVGATSKVEGQDLKNEQVLIKVDGIQLIIAGGDPKSTLNAVYTFLENQLGCRFYAPDAEDVPKQQKITIDRKLDYSYTPEITTRTVHSRLYYQNEDFADKRKVTYDAFPGYVSSARVHTFHHFVPKDRYYEAHPEYYALRGDRRVPTQLCLTNEAVFNIVRDTVATLLEENPDAKVISVSQDDNQQYCQCGPCQAIHDHEGSPSGSMITFVNKVAESFPDVQISTLAYQYTRKAPKHIKPKENVLITLCSIECDRSASIGEKCNEFANDLIAWGEKTNNIRIWDYTTQFTNFLAPFPNIHTLQPNIQLFRDNNAKWIFEQHSQNPSELFELRSYLMAKLLWNPDVSVDSVMNEFMDGYYEEAATYVGNYIRMVHEEIQIDSAFFLFLYGDPSQAYTSYLKPELLNQYDTWFDEAERAVADKPDVLQRVKRARLGVDFAILEASKQNTSDELTLVKVDELGKKWVPERLQKRLADFKSTCEAADITAMNEMRYTVDEYLDFYGKTLTRAQQKNIARNKQVELLTRPKKYAGENPQTLTDRALGGANFYANWLGFEGNDMEAVIDLEKTVEVNKVSSAFLQVVNHIVFFPKSVSYYGSLNGRDFRLLGKVTNKRPLKPDSKINDIQYFNSEFNTTKVRYLKILADNMETAPVWHHGTGLGSWIFVDEIIVE